MQKLCGVMPITVGYKVYSTSPFNTHLFNGNKRDSEILNTTESLFENNQITD